MRPSDNHSVRDVRHAAVEWVVRHDRGLTPAERVAFQHWREASPWHAAEFERASASWDRLERAGAVSRLRDEAEEVVGRAQRRRQRQFGLVGAGLLAAAAAVALAWLDPIPAPSPPAMTPKYQVLASTARVETLPDGSTVLLNGDSQIEIAFSEAERHVWLRHGEALFTVAKNPARPFFVTADAITVRAVGTAFNVRLDPTEVHVLVTEGRVRLDGSTGPDAHSTAAAGPADGAAPTLGAGESAVVGRKGESPALITTVGPAEIEQALAWQSTRLAFNDTSLDEVVAAFNQYNTRKLLLGAPGLRSRKITGVFRADNADGFIRLLEAGADVQSHVRGPGETVLSPVR